MPDAGEIPGAPLPSASASGPAADDPGTGGSADEDTVSWTLIGGTVAIVVALAGLALWFVRRRTAAETLTPEAAWARLRARLARLQVTWPDSTTPRQAVPLVVARIEERTGRELGADGARALEQLARDVERERYAPTPSGAGAHELAHRVDQVVEAAGRKVSGPGRPVDGPSAPRDGS